MNKKLKLQIIDAALKKAGLDDSGLGDEYDALFERARVCALGGAEAEKKIHGLIEHFEKLKSEGVRVPLSCDQIVRTSIRWRFIFGGTHRMHEAKHRALCPAGACVVDDRSIAKDLHKLDMKQAEFDKKRGELYDEMSAILNSFTTVKKLVAAWPEIASLLPSEEKTVTNLPALRTDELNRVIGL